MTLYDIVSIPWYHGSAAMCVTLTEIQQIFLFHSVSASFLSASWSLCLCRCGYLCFALHSPPERDNIISGPPSNYASDGLLQRPVGAVVDLDAAAVVLLQPQDEFDDEVVLHRRDR